MVNVGAYLFSRFWNVIDWLYLFWRLRSLASFKNAENNRKVRTTFCNFKFGGEWEDSNREIMKALGRLESRKFSENPRRTEISTSSPKSSHWKTRRPWGWGRELGSRLHADRKSRNGRQRENISRTDEVSNLYSVVKILSDFRTPCVIFTSTRPSESRPLECQMIRKTLDVGVFEPFDWGRGIIGTTERTQGYSSPPCWEALKNVSHNNRRFCCLISGSVSRNLAVNLFQSADLSWE